MDAQPQPIINVESMSIKEQLYKHSNLISELSQLLSSKFWGDEEIKDRYLFAALVDGISLAANNIDDLVAGLNSEN
jgi:hypothetical protein